MREDKQQDGILGIVGVLMGSESCNEGLIGGRGLGGS